MSEDHTDERRWTDEELRELDTGTTDDEAKSKRNAVSNFLAEKKRLNKEDSYIEKIDRILTEFEEYLYRDHDDHLCNISAGEVLEFNSFLKGNTEHQTYYTVTNRTGDPKTIDIVDTTRHGYLQILVDFYSWLVDDGIVSKNPAKTALGKLSDDDFDLTPPGRPQIEMFEMEEFLQWLPNPLVRALLLFTLKTGGRLGQIVNVDLCDVHLDHPLYDALCDKYGVELVREIQEKPDSVYFMPGFNADTEIRGEVRGEGSKTQRNNGCIVPIDDELKTALLEYLLIRRPAHNHEPHSSPLFVKPSLHGDLDRLTQDAVYGLVTKKNHKTGVLKKYGWYEQGAPTEENVTYHYFRHYFTHNLKHNKGVYRDYMSQEVRKYIRGDVPDGNTSEETVYDHDEWNVWEEYIQKPYLDAIYTFDVYN